MLLGACAGDGRDLALGPTTSLSVQAAFSSDAAARASLVTLDRARVRVVRLPDRTILDREIALTPGQEDVEFRAQISLNAVLETLRVEVQLLSGPFVAFAGAADMRADARLPVNVTPPIELFLSAPALEVLTPEVRMEADAGAASASGTARIRNVGGGTLSWTASAPDAPWLLPSPTTGTVPSLQEGDVPLVAEPGDLTPGTYSTTVEIADPNAIDAPQSVPVTLVVLEGDPVLSVLAAGEGEGRVRSTPDGIDCTVAGGRGDGACEAAFPNGTRITLTATAGTGSTFAGWSEGCVGRDSECAVVLSEGTSVTARFEPAPILVETSLIDAAPTRVHTTVDLGDAADPASVRLRNAGTAPLDWSAATTASWLGVGPASGTLVPGETAILDLAFVTASLPVGEYAASLEITDPEAGNSPIVLPVTLSVSGTRTVPVTIRNVGTGTGTTVSDTPGIECLLDGGTPSGDCQDRFPPGTTIVLTAVPQEPSVFTGWTGPCAGQPATCVITVPEDGPGPGPVTVIFDQPGTPTTGPLLDLSAGSVSFELDEAGRPVPDGVGIEIENAGDGSLSWTAAGDVPWLAVTPDGGTVPAGGSATARVSVDPAGLPAGTHGGVVTIASPSAANSPLTVLVELIVPSGTEPPPPPPPADPAEIELSPASLTFAADEGSDPDPAAQPFTIANTGGSLLDWTASDDAPWLSLSAAAGTTQPGAQTQVTATVSSAGLAPGAYQATISVADPAASNSPQTVTVSLTVNAVEPPPPPPPPADPAEIELSPTSLTFAADEGSDPDPAAQPFTIANTGGSLLDWTAADDAPWLSLSAAAGTTQPGAQTQVTATVSSAGLAPGAYQATISVADPAASNSPQTVTVSLTVNAVEPPPPPPPPADPAEIELSPTSLTFAADEGSDPDPAARPFTIANTGGSLLDWTVSDDAPWLSLSSGSGELAAGAQTQVTATVSSAGLAPGDYQATITVADPAASNSPQTVTVSLTVNAVEPPPPPPPPADPAEIELSPTSLTFAADEGSDPDPAARPFTIANTGGSLLDWTAADDAPWLSLSAAAGTTQPGAQTQVTATVSSAGLAPGAYQATISVADPAASNSPQTVTVSLTVNAVEPPPPPPPPADPAEIELSPTSLTFAADEGSDPDPAAQPFTIANTGGSLLDWTAADDAPWLSLSAAAGTTQPGAQTQVTATVSSAGLAPGAYQATISVADPAASNSPQTVTVSLTVNAVEPPPPPPPPADPAEIELSPTSLTFAADEGSDPDPAAQPFTIANTGGSLLDWTAADDAPWLSLSAAAGTTQPGAQTQVTATVSSAGLAPGAYQATISVADPAASNSPQTVTVSLTVNAVEPPPPPPPPADPAEIELSPTSLTFAADEGSDPDPAAQPFTIANTGGSLLDWTAADDAPWLSLSAAAGTTQPGAQTQVTATVSSAGLAPGAYQATISVADPAASNSPQTVTVSLTVNAVEPPPPPPPPQGVAFELSPDTLYFVAEHGSDPIPNAQTFRIESIGTETVNWRADESVTWMTINGPSGRLDPGEFDDVRVIVNGIGSLDPGVLIATITVHDPDAQVTPQEVVVHVEVLPRP